MRIMILGDGDTWTDMEGCEIREVEPKEVREAMEEDRMPKGETVATFTTHSIVMASGQTLGVKGQL